MDARFDLEPSLVAVGRPSASRRRSRLAVALGRQGDAVEGLRGGAGAGSLSNSKRSANGWPRSEAISLTAWA